jgi:hypothetical protein
LVDRGRDTMGVERSLLRPLPLVAAARARSACNLKSTGLTLQNR